MIIYGYWLRYDISLPFCWYRGWKWAQWGKDTLWPVHIIFRCIKVSGIKARITSILTSETDVTSVIVLFKVITSITNKFDLLSKRNGFSKPMSNSKIARSWRLWRLKTSNPLTSSKPVGWCPCSIPLTCHGLLIRLTSIRVEKLSCRTTSISINIKL